MTEDTRLRRRNVLSGLAVGAVGLAGCLSGGDSDGSNSNEAPNQTVTSGETPTTSNSRLPAPVLGDPEASVTLAVYEDYACPHCADYNLNGFPELESAYIDSEQIRYEHRDAPIPVADPGSWQAASAAREAQARHGDDAFWAYAKKLFENSRSIGGNVESLFITIGDDLGLDDADAIAQAGVNRVHDRTVRADRQRAGEIGVSGTPAFAIDGEVVTSGFGDSTLSTVESALDRKLSESA